MSRLPLALLLLAACATAPPEPAPGPATSTAPPAPAAEAAPMPAAGVVGDYTVTIAATDVPATLPDSIRNGVVGAWRIALHEGNHLVVTYNGRQVVEGAYRVEGNRLILGEDTGEYACRAPATYTWQRTGDQLALTRVEDTCGGRVVVLTTRPLTRGG